MFTQSHLAANNVETALVVAMRLMEYDDLINPTDSYSLIALTSLYAKNFGICSKAFTRLEGMESGDVTNELPGGAAIGALALESTDLDVTATVAPKESAAKAPTKPSATARLLPTVSPEDSPRKFGDLAIKIFTKNTPQDTTADRVKCLKCGTLNKDWAPICQNSGCHQPFTTCILTGKAITTQKTWQCGTCHHRAIEAEMSGWENCPLCHSPRPVDRR